MEMQTLASHHGTVTSLAVHEVLTKHKPLRSVCVLNDILDNLHALIRFHGSGEDLLHVVLDLPGRHRLLSQFNTLISLSAAGGGFNVLHTTLAVLNLRSILRNQQITRNDSLSPPSIP